MAESSQMTLIIIIIIIIIIFFYILYIFYLFFSFLRAEKTKWCGNKNKMEIEIKKIK